MKLKIILPLLTLAVVSATISGYILLANNAKMIKPKQEVVSFAVAPSQAPSFLPTPPSLQSIFTPDHSWIATLSAQHIKTMIATGDIIPARSVNAGVIRHNNDPVWPYQKVKDWFIQQHADITFVNLESPQIKDCPTTDEGMIFCGNQQNIAGLKAIGVTVANLANNHAGNHGQSGVDQTVQLLKTNSITPVGIGEAAILNIKGTRFAFLGFNDIAHKESWLNWADDSLIQQYVSVARKQADIVIVQFHWGIEYQAQPSTEQMRLGHLAIDSGADLVIGNHPHWIEPIEVYKNKLITYAHGNFIFDQMWSLKTRQGVIGKYIFYDNQLIDVQYFPLQIDDYGQAHFVDATEKAAILSDLQNQSGILAQKKGL